MSTLHAHEFGPAVLLRCKLHPGELVRPHGRRADVAHFSGAHEVVQCAHCLFDGRVGVVAVDLEEVYVGCVEAREGGFDGVEDCGAGEALFVGVS